MSINSEMTALADAIRDKSGVTGKLSISGMTTAVSNISVGGGESGDIDLSGVTVTADTMLSGIVAVGADGNKVTGNIQTVTPSVNKNTFTVGKGYVAEAFSQTIAEATVTETDSSVTITPGYVGDTLVYEIGGNGEGGESVEYGYITDDGKVQYVDLSTKTITSVGEPVEADVYIFKYENRIPLTFTAEEANSTVRLESADYDDILTDLVDLSGIHYRLDTYGDWIPYNEGEDIVLSNVGDKVSFMNTKNRLGMFDPSVIGAYFYQVVNFCMSGKIRADGSVQSMVNYAYCTPGCFAGLFRNCTSLTQAPELPAKHLARDCYSQMFQGCTSLTQAPELPATRLSVGCYSYMFTGCTSMSSITVHFYSWVDGDDECTSEWLSGVPQSGTFYKPAELPGELGEDRIPRDWNVQIV